MGIPVRTADLVNGELDKAEAGCRLTGREAQER